MQAECEPWLETVGHNAQRTLELADLSRGESWAIFRFKTGVYTSGSLYVRMSASSHFQENILSMHTLMIRGAIFNTFSSPPRMRLAGKVFPLVWNSSVETRAAMRPDQSLILFTPLTSVSLRLPHLGMASFAPVGEGVPSSEEERELGLSILDMAGLRPDAMTNFLNHHRDDSWDSTLDQERSCQGVLS